MISLREGSLFDRWNLGKNRYVWGTCTRKWRIRIVGPLLKNGSLKSGKFYYSVHDANGMSKYNEYVTGLLEAKRAALVVAFIDIEEVDLDLRQLDQLNWRAVKLLLKEEKQRLIDDSVMAGIAGVMPQDFYK